jgi:hypothetical protein
MLISTVNSSCNPTCSSQAPSLWVSFLVLVARYLTQALFLVLKAAVAVVSLAVSHHSKVVVVALAQILPSR